MTETERARALSWLYDAGNPIIKLWAAERLGAPFTELESLRVEMLNHTAVQYWLGCLRSFSEKPIVHNSFDTCLENSMRKILLFGVRESDFAELKEFNAFTLDRLQYQLAHPYWMNPVEYTILASWLAAMGHDEPAVAETILERLESSTQFEALGGSDMYTDPVGYPSIPAARRGRPLIRPAYYEGNRYRFPLVYDLFAYANLPPSLAGRKDVNVKIDSVLQTSMNENYQRLPWGYGLLFIPPNKYYGMGWSLHLPRYFEGDANSVPDGDAVWWAEAMSRFPEATRSEWFRGMLVHLEGFRTKDGFWKFPAQYLCEGPAHYFVGGGHMGLGENRKETAALKMESTAWLLRIYENIWK